MWIFKLLNAWGSLGSNLRHAMGTARSKQIQQLEVNKFSRDTAETMILLRNSLLRFILQLHSKFWNTACILWLTANTMVLYRRCRLTKTNRVKNKRVYVHSPLGKISFQALTLPPLLGRKAMGTRTCEPIKVSCWLLFSSIEICSTV